MSKFTKEMRKKYKYSINENSCVPAEALVTVIERLEKAEKLLLKIQKGPLHLLKLILGVEE